MDTTPVELRPILAEDTDGAAEFLHRELNHRVPVAGWRVLMNPPWGQAGPNRGFQLVEGTQIVGVYAAVYSTRDVDGESLAVCNLAAFCVLEQYRSHSVRLIRALIGQKGFEFSDLSPSGNVVELNRRLGFTPLDTTTRLMVNLPWLPRSGTEVTSDHQRVSAVLTGRDAVIFRDHQLPASARHVIVVRGDQYAYVVFRKDRRKGVPLFATILYVGGSKDLLRFAWRNVRAHLLWRAGALVTLAEPRLIGFTSTLGMALRHPRPRMVRGKRLAKASIDYMYSELALVEW